MPPYYLTTPIYYVNDAPHVGTAYTTVNADALARWHRLVGDDVTFLTGTDEHGAKIVEAAEAHGMSPQAWTDQTSARFIEAWERLDISNDDFIRTTEPRHYAVVQEFLQRIYDNGFIELGQYTGLYCVSCEDYYTPDQLVDGLCPVHGRAVIEMQEDNYFFKLSAFEQPLLDYYDSHPDFVRPIPKRNEALGFIRGGLNDVSITRTSMKWGVPVPWDDGHVFYVWYDALINYLTAASYGSDPVRFNALWGAAHHLIGKDILKFHCVWWPAMCLAAGIAPPAEIFVHGYLLMEGQKLGKTLIQSGVVGEGDGARSLKITEVSPLALADQQPGQPGLPGGHRGALQVRRRRSGLRSGRRIGRSGGRGIGSRGRGLGPLGPPGRAGGHVAPHRRRQRRVGDDRALEDGPRARGRVDTGQRARGAAHRGHLDLAGHAVHLGRDLAPHRPGGRSVGGPPAG